MLVFHRGLFDSCISLAVLQGVTFLYWDNNKPVASASWTVFLLSSTQAQVVWNEKWDDDFLIQ